ncbi:outer membrane protein [Devosia sp. MC521]|uniref:outer membrane protein n=1 Tax=Devosia sp. MC521 TaxID=2759954 RepID=UPI0015F93251|nr:outer membrane protein [Devosia sp. MC521]QMW61517.1 porin family protein [Devosia sp. MC521]
MPPVRSKWGALQTGLYAGANVGLGSGDVYWIGSHQFNFKGAFAGVQAGYNHDLGGLVIGAEADIQLSGIINKDTSPGRTPAVTSRIENFGSARARVGVAIDRVMPFVSGGFAWANVSLEDVTRKETEFYTGWTVGGGVEVALTDNITAKGEYFYAKFGSKQFGTGYDFDLESHVARVGLNYKF